MINEAFVTAKFRRTTWSDPKADVDRPFLPGASIAEIIEAFDRPPEFERYGGVYLKRDRFDVGHVIPRRHWKRIRPKPGTVLFVSIVPQGGGGGGGSSGKQTFAIVGAIALMALSMGAASFLAPTLGVVGAKVVGAAIAVGGSMALQTLTKPTAGREVAPTAQSISAAGGATLGVAGISQNPITAYAQIPAVLGTMRVSPPLLAKPFTLIEQNDQVVHVICGVCGPCDISEIMINDTAIADFPSGTVEYETREGLDDDDELTLITQSVFEENVNQELSTHRLDTDQATLIAPYTASYPKPYIMKTATRTNDFRVILHFPSGFGRFDTSDNQLIAFRVRIRPVGGAWVNLPEMHMEAAVRGPMRQEIWFVWGDDDTEADLLSEVSGESSFFNRFYYENSEWTANSYFLLGSGSPNANVNHVYAGRDEVFFFLHTDTFAQGQYEVEITRSRASSTSGFTTSAYGGGLFTYTTISDPNYSIPSQKDFINNVVVQSYASFRDEYPIVERGLALIAVKARNVQIQSVSALFKSKVGGVITNNPAVLFEEIATGALNARPLDPAKLEDLSDWETHCTNEGLSCNRVVESGSVEDALNSVAICGEAIPRRSDKWGVVIDKDRSAEDMVALITPHQIPADMPLVITKEFLDGARGLLPTYQNEDNNYALTEFSTPVFDDGVSVTADTLVDGVNYEGLTTESLARRRAKRDLRAARMRSVRYSFGLHQRQLDFTKGAKIGLQHDILINHFATGRVKSYQASGGNLVSVTLNTVIEDVPIIDTDNLFEVDDILLLKNIFDLSEGVAVGMMIELPTGAVTASIPVSAVSGATLTVQGTVAVPSGLASECVITVGPLARECRPLIVGSIMPKNEFYAQIECVDLAPEIYQGL